MNYTSRLQKIKKELSKQKLDALLISSIPNIIYLTDYAGFSTTEREAYILATKHNLFLFTDGRYTHAVKNIKHTTLKEISALSPLLKTLDEIIKKEKIISVGFEADNLTVAEYNRLKKNFLKPKAVTLSTLRLLKEKDEIDAIQKACALGDKAFAHVIKKIKPGVTEKELAFELESFIKKHGASLSFPTIVAFGKNAAIPHHLTRNEKLKKNNFILLDFGVRFENYCSDMTRTVFFGKATKEEKKVYQTVYDAQQKSIELLNNKAIKQYSIGIHASSVDLAARDYVISQGFPNIPHSVGHGIGIEVHEAPTLSPKSKDMLTPGMVFSIEPGIYLPDAYGVRIEDLAVLEKTGPRLLTHAPKSLIEL